MAGGAVGGGTYTKKVAFIYIFNLVVGVGALALPYAVHQTGIILGTIFLAFCALLAYITITFIIETMSASNALLKIEKQKLEREQEQEKTQIDVVVGAPSVVVAVGGDVSVNYDDDVVVTNTTGDHGDEKHVETSPLLLNKDSKVKGEKKRRKRGANKKKLAVVEEYSPEELSYYQNPFAIDLRTEIGLLSSQFLGPVGKYVFYFIIWIYLFGDLAIYAVAVPSTLLKVVGPLFGFSHVSIQLSGIYNYNYFVVIAVCRLLLLLNERTCSLTEKSNCC